MEPGLRHNPWLHGLAAPDGDRQVLHALAAFNCILGVAKRTCGTRSWGSHSPRSRRLAPRPRSWIFITLDDNATWCFKAPKNDPNCTAEYRLRPVPCPSRFPPLKGNPPSVTGRLRWVREAGEVEDRVELDPVWRNARLTVLEVKEGDPRNTGTGAGGKPCKVLTIQRQYRIGPRDATGAWAWRAVALRCAPRPRRLPQWQ
jgi:hypothetical protein